MIKSVKFKFNFDFLNYLFIVSLISDSEHVNFFLSSFVCLFHLLSKKSDLQGLRPLIPNL